MDKILKIIGGFSHGLAVVITTIMKAWWYVVSIPMTWPTQYSDKLAQEGNPINVVLILLVGGYYIFAFIITVKLAKVFYKKIWLPIYIKIPEKPRELVTAIVLLPILLTISVWILIYSATLMVYSVIGVISLVAMMLYTFDL